jgi:hypothetical protein
VTQERAIQSLDTALGKKSLSPLSYLDVTSTFQSYSIENTDSDADVRPFTATSNSKSFCPFAGAKKLQKGPSTRLVETGSVL